MVNVEQCYCKTVIHKYITLTTCNPKREEYILNVKYTRKEASTLELEMPRIATPDSIKRFLFCL